MNRNWKHAVVLAATGSVLLAVPGHAATPKTGGWSGDTDQGASVSFTVKKAKHGRLVKKIEVSRIETVCDPPMGEDYDATYKDVEFQSPFKTKVQKGGKFSPEYVGPDSMTFKGKFTSKAKSSGSFKVTFGPTGSGVSCSSGKVSWRAHRS